MTCPTCGSENDAGQRFCGNCGTRLGRACPNCGAPYPEGRRFCGECGTALEPAAAGGAAARPAGGGTGADAAGHRGPVDGGPIAERRLVSVLFADLVGFTPFAEERDAEDTREMLSQYADLCREVIGRYGGTVEKFIGDAVMAVWGAPTAREDDAERAVRAALDIVDAVPTLGPGIQARAGVLTGEAAINIGATNQGLVVGDIVNTASRLQGAAQPGTVLVGEATMRAASAAIAFEVAGDQTLKGKASPVPAWRALRVVAQRGGQGRSDLPEPPFVGRDEELRLLKDLIATTGRDRRTRLVSITGPAGIGKSRLAWELEKYIDGIRETIFWHHGRSPAYGEGVTFWALGEMVRRRAGLTEADDAETSRAGIAKAVAEYVSSDEDRRWVEPALLTLLGLEPAPAGGRDVLFAAWRIFFEQVANQGTTILLFEDLHWADSGLLDFIEHVLEWARNVPLIVISLARPELLDRRPEWGSATRHLTKMALEPLPDHAMRSLLDGFVPGLPSSAVETILRRADGVPLYAVETVRMLVAEGRLARDGEVYRPARDLGELAVPETLRSLIASRLDALDPADHGLVADASVLGQSFTLASLAAVAGQDPEAIEPRLRGLVRRELLDLEIDPRSPERGQYRFVQSLIREVAYGTLARRDRRARHLAAARFFEAAGDDELAGLLASHYVAAREASAEGPEADAVAVQARLALSGAAERAATLGAHEQAVAYLRQAIDLTTDDAEHFELLLRAATSADLTTSYDTAEGLAGEAVALAERRGDRSGLGRAQALLGQALIDHGRTVEAIAALESAVEAFGTEGDPEAMADLLANLSRAYMRSSRAEDSIRTADRALELAEHLHLDRVIAEAFNNKGSSLGYLGRNREASALLRAAIVIAHEGGFVAAEIRATNNLGTSSEDQRFGRDTLREGRRLALRVGSRGMATWAAASIRFCDYVLAEGWDEALDDAAEERRESTAGNPLPPMDEIRNIAISSGMWLARGVALDDAVSRLDALSTQLSDPFGLALTRYVAGDRALMAGDYATAREAMLAAVELAPQASTFIGAALRPAVWARDLSALRAVAAQLEAHPASDPETRAQRFAARGAIAALEGRVDDALTEYRTALALFDSAGFDFERARVGLDLLKVLGPEHPIAREAADRSRAIFERVAATAYLELLDEALAAAPSTLTAARGASAAEVGRSGA